DAVTTLAWQLTRTDSLLMGGHARATAVTKKGDAEGVVPELGWRHDFGPGSGVELRAGLGAWATSATTQAVWLPAGDARVHLLFGRLSGALLEATASAGLDAATDPLGALLEERAGGALGAALRVSHELSFHVDTSAFAPLP